MNIRYIIHLILVIFLTITIQKLILNIYPFNENKVLPEIQNSTYVSRFKALRSSSVWCNGFNHTERQCRFDNLCFKKDTNDYIFLNNEKLSLKYGLPSDRSVPLLDLSSVSDHNQYYFNYVEIPASVMQNNLSKLYEIEILDEKTVIFGRFKPDNLMHAFHDDLLPLYFTLNQIGNNEIKTIFFDDNYPKDVSQRFIRLIYLLLFPKIISKHEMNDNTIYCFKKASIGLTKTMNWYEYGFRSPQSPISRTDEQQLLISKTIRRFTNELKLIKNCSQYYVILILRESTRKILNVKQLLDLISELTKLTVIQVMIEESEEQLLSIIQKIYCARLMIGMHGSGLILSMFLPMGSSIIELFPYAINPDNVTPFKTLTQLNGMQIKYYYWKNTILSNTVTHNQYPKELGGIDHLSDEEKLEIVLNLEDVPKHLCCSNTRFLYRIYQDTFVDITSFSPVLKAAFDYTKLSVDSKPRQLSSGRVIDSRCYRNDIDGVNYIKIEWSEPWNLIYINDSNMTAVYQLLIQENDSNTAKSILTSDREHVFIGDSNKSYNIWIRCKLESMSGPYNQSPLMC